MLANLESACLADPVFYDTVARWDDADTMFAQTTAETPAGWQRRDLEVWVNLFPDGHRMPPQGWKIHVSAGMPNAARVVDIAYRYCVSAGVPFKFLRGRNVLLASNLKYASRGSSGKVVTIYPDDDQQLHTVLTELSAQLAGEKGPYILSDLRWGDGPLYVRYGGFTLRHCPDDNGELVPALARPDGTLVPDRRSPVFTVPDWVTLPDFLQPHLAARQGGDVDFPYKVDSALHFSNGGGVYLARRTGDDRQVVLKEARPHAGLDGYGRDAVRRLRGERDALAALAGVAGVPELYEYRVAWEHEFLVQEYLPGQSLFSWMATHHPFIHADPDADEIARYSARAAHVADQVAQLLARIHARGVIAGDLHAHNLLIDDDDRVSLVDFELSVPIDDQGRRGLAVPGYAAPDDVAGVAVDHHALAALRLWLLMPLIELTPLAPYKIEEYLELVTQRFPVSAQYLQAIRTDLRSHTHVLPPALRARPEVDLHQQGADWQTAQKSIVAGIVRSATPQRTDRLFPGDVAQLTAEGAGTSFGYGAAGVLWALWAVGAERPDQLEEWLCEAAGRVPRLRAGFYDGLYGLAYVLDQLGHVDAAEPLWERALALTDRLRQPGLHSGLAGAGLALLRAEQRTGDTAISDQVAMVARQLAQLVSSGGSHGVAEVRIDPAASIVGSRAGLLHGWSGAALFFLHLYERSGDSAYLDVATAALHRDLDLCREAPDGSLQVDEGFRLCPYLEVGSAGIALVGAELLRRRPDERVNTALPGLVRAMQPEFVRQPELMYGRAGLIGVLARIAALRSDLGAAETLQRHLARLAWHAVGYHGHLAFPGRQLRRLSMDVASGSAGILLAIGAARGGTAEFLPFLTTVTA